MTGLIAQVAISVALIATAIILHELAHGYAALVLGDNTARLAGRLSLKPWRHVDRFGTLILPGILLVSQLLSVGKVLFMFGWAKPVPVDPMRFRHPRQMMALVAIAGPLMNFSLAFLAALGLRDVFLPGGVREALADFIQYNLLLGIFNLVPIPPLDGGRIAVGVLPLKLAIAWSHLEKFGIVFVLLLLAAPALLRQQGVDFDPLGRTLIPVVGWAYGVILHAAGVLDVG
jgi:Zn-dependent protease